MKYKDKIKYAEGVAEKLFNNQSTQQIKDHLIAENLSDSDIHKIMESSRKIIGEKYRATIQFKLLNKEPITHSDFNLLDEGEIKELIQMEREALRIIERDKVAQSFRQGVPRQEIINSVNTDFYPKNNAIYQLNELESIRTQNKPTTRFFYVIIGGGILLIGIGLTLATLQGESVRIFTGIMLIGLVIMIKGFVGA